MLFTSKSVLLDAVDCCHDHEPKQLVKSTAHARINYQSICERALKLLRVDAQSKFSVIYLIQVYSKGCNGIY